jgi:hypothetical protein
MDKILIRGQTNRFVYSVQNFLSKEARINPGPLDGILGSQTIAAWNKFLDVVESKPTVPPPPAVPSIPHGNASASRSETNGIVKQAETGKGIQRIYNDCHRAVSPNHGSPPNSFLDQLIDAINPLPDEVFAENDRTTDIYKVMDGALGPWTSLLHRKAAMCEVLRVQAAFESDWNWNAGVDINNHTSMTHIEGQETGAFQVSADSMRSDHSLRDCVDRALGNHEPLVFIHGMKANHALAVEYCARLLRFNTTWCGTINDHSQVVAHVRPDAVAEFQTFLHAGSGPTVTSPALAAPVPSEEVPAAGATGGSVGDKARIPTLLQLARNVSTLDSVQEKSAAELLAYDGEVYPHDGCAITLSVLLRDAGINVPLIYQAVALGQHLRGVRKWEVIPVGQQAPGDVGSTCGSKAHHGSDHIYLVLKKLNDDEMLIADNQSTQPHFRFASGQGKTPTKFFLRAT